jgi:hypothetical protein
VILNWKTLNERERESAWDALEEWVWWLRSTYPEAREAIVDCWPAHADMVRELTALYVWWEDVYEPLLDEVPDPDAQKPPPDTREEASGRSAVAWHEALHHAVQRWRISSKCSPTECLMDRQTADLTVEWQKRHTRTMALINAIGSFEPSLLGDPGERSGRPV